jgi:hypothetical protein
VIAVTLLVFLLRQPFFPAQNVRNAVGILDVALLYNYCAQRAIKCQNTVEVDEKPLIFPQPAQHRFALLPIPWITPFGRKSIIFVLKTIRTDRVIVHTIIPHRLTHLLRWWIAVAETNIYAKSVDITYIVANPVAPAHPTKNRPACRTRFQTAAGTLYQK